jgi:hypothetical protein
MTMRNVEGKLSLRHTKVRMQLAWFRRWPGGREKELKERSSKLLPEIKLQPHCETSELDVCTV